jgi:tetratricopeptide (TPR) repeat protein
MMTARASLLCLLFVAGCANPLNERHVRFYTDAGAGAEQAGNWELAERNYERALVNARIAQPDSGATYYRSMAAYNLGRAKGHLCKFDEAETLLTAALEMEEKLSGPGSGVTTMRLFELGRLNLDRGQFAKSVPYLERGLAAVTKLGVEQSDPGALANAYDDYAAALQGAGDMAKADVARQEALRIRKAHPGRSARFLATRYKDACSAK